MNPNHDNWYSIHFGGRTVFKIFIYIHLHTVANNTYKFLPFLHGSVIVYCRLLSFVQWVGWIHWKHQQNAQHHKSLCFFVFFWWSAVVYCYYYGSMSVWVWICSSSNWNRWSATALFIVRHQNENDQTETKRSRADQRVNFGESYWFLNAI